MEVSSLADYDIVGDVHGCLNTLRALIQTLGYEPNGRHPGGRRLAFVGDLVTRGAHSEETYFEVMRMIGSGRASTVRGNNDIDWAQENPEMGRWLASMPLQLLVDEGRLLIVHAAIRGDLISQESEEAERWCLYGNSDARVRPDWQAAYDGEPFVVAGHSVVKEPRFVDAGGGSVLIDTGAAHGPNARDRFTGEPFTGYLSALRWPERDILSVPTDPRDLVDR